MARSESSQILAELATFASFTGAEQRYLRRSLDVAYGRDACSVWARHPGEVAEIEAQANRYACLGALRAAVPDDDVPGIAEAFLSDLIMLSAADLSERRITSFAAFRFLYERLVGQGVAPWLTSVFCAAAGLPRIHPDHRRQLLGSISEQDVVAASWSVRPPHFYPSWVDKVPEAVN